LKAKWIAVFDTYLGGDFEKAVKKMEKRLDEKVSTLKLIISGLSIRVGGNATSNHSLQINRETLGSSDP